MEIVPEHELFSMSWRALNHVIAKQLSSFSIQSWEKELQHHAFTSKHDHGMFPAFHSLLGGIAMHHNAGNGDVAAETTITITFKL